MLPSPADVQSIFRAPHSIGMSVSTQDLQRRALRRNRLIATALLAAMAALFISTTLPPQPGFWILLVRATAEAALVGGLADWFAVPPPSRQPLGLPIPHTAILPRNKDRIGEGLAIFIERNFLSPDILRAKLRSIDPARLVADWLSMPANAFHETLLDRLLNFCGEFLEEREEQLYMAAEAQRRRWWIPKVINRQIARALIGGVKELPSKLREPGTPARRNLLREIERLAEQLRTSPVYRARVEEAKLRLLEDAEVKAWLGSVWGDIKRLLLADFASPQSRMDHALGAVIRSLGHHLGANTAMRKRVNRTMEAMALEIVPWRAGLAQFLIEIVRQWDTSSFINRIELVVGSDLQYIRINGTLVGGLVGCLLYLVSAALG